jgi:hypothetical protein
LGISIFFELLNKPSKNQTNKIDLYNSGSELDPLMIEDINISYKKKLYKIHEFKDKNGEILDISSILEMNINDTIYYLELYGRDNLSPNRWYNLPSELHKCHYTFGLDIYYSKNLNELDKIE